MNCSHALKKLKLDLNGIDIEQHSRITSYMAALNIRGHEDKLEIVDDEFMRLSIIFREGLRTYKSYSERAISVNGTFKKTSIGRASLLRAFEMETTRSKLSELGSCR